MFATVKRLARYSLVKRGHQAIVPFSVESFQGSLTRKECARKTPRQLYGQPTASTHPHLVKEGEVLPGIQLQEFKRRRSVLMERIMSEEPVKGSNRQQLVIIPSSSKVYMSDKIPYVFRQNTDFLYFTGCQEPDSVLVLAGRNNDFRSFLFMRQKDDHSELWDGPRTGVEAAKEMFGVDHSLPVTEFERFFMSFMNEHKKSVLWYDSTEVVQQSLHRKLCHLVKMSENQAFVSPKNVIHRIRLIKSRCEIDLMKKSCEIASKAIERTIQISRPGMSEHQLFATVDYECRMNGAEFLAYPPVVASGENANIIHYITNNQIIRDGDMVLMDAGCEYHGYTSDITRTWPINGTFTSEQRLLYEVVLDVQKILIENLKNMPSLDQVFHDMCYLLGRRLQEIGLIPKNLDDNKLLAAAYVYCPHHVSHYLGMDVHDTGNVSRSIRIQPGMVVTIEPGVYVNPKNKLAPPEFSGLGIRIEDDVLITENGPLVLTKDCPKEIAEIEALASQCQ